MLKGKDKVTSLNAKSMMNTGVGKDVTKIKVRRSSVSLPGRNKKPQKLKASRGKIT